MLSDYIGEETFKESINYFRFKIFTFTCGIFIIIFSETTIRFIEGTILSNIKIFMVPIILIVILYFNYWENVFKNNNFLYITNCWMKRSLPIKSRISFKDNNSIVNGIYKGINNTGSIRLLINNKEYNFFNLEIEILNLLGRVVFPILFNKIKLILSSLFFLSLIK